MIPVCVGSISMTESSAQMLQLTISFYLVWVFFVLTGFISLPEMGGEKVGVGLYCD